MQLDDRVSVYTDMPLDMPRNERERTRLLNERSDARENVIRFARSSQDARNIIAALGLGDDDDLLAMPVAEPVPSDASPAGFCDETYECALCVPIEDVEPAQISRFYMFHRAA